MTYRMRNDTVRLVAIIPTRLEIERIVTGPTGPSLNANVFADDVLHLLTAYELASRIESFASIKLSTVENVTVFRFLEQLRQWARACANGLDPRPFVDFTA